jgi:hypothetical protein
MSPRFQIFQSEISNSLGGGRSKEFEFIAARAGRRGFTKPLTQARLKAGFIENVSRHYNDTEWARIVAGIWAAERPGQVRMFMTTKRTLWSSELGREYGWVLCPIRRPSRALVVWLLANLEEQV